MDSSRAIKYLSIISFVLISCLGNFYRLQGKSQIVQDELVKLGESMVSSVEGTRALALELCREFEEKFLRHVTGGEVKKSSDCMDYASHRNLYIELWLLPSHFPWYLMC